MDLYNYQFFSTKHLRSGLFIVLITSIKKNKEELEAKGESPVLGII